MWDEQGVPVGTLRLLDYLFRWLDECFCKRSEKGDPMEKPVKLRLPNKDGCLRLLMKTGLQIILI